MNKQKNIMKNIKEYQKYVLNKLIESTEVIYDSKLDYSDSWFYITYPYNPPEINESCAHPFSYISFSHYVQERYGILENEVGDLWGEYKKYVYNLSSEIEKRGPNDIDLLT
jgi:hypothetical protein